MATERCLPRGEPGDDRCGRVEPHRLLEDRQRVGQLGQVGQRRHPSTEDLVDLALQRPQDMGVLGEQVERPREGDGRRLVAGREHRQDLVPQLPVTHALAGLGVLRCQQHVQQVVPRLERPAPFGDEPVDEGVQRGHHRRRSGGCSVWASSSAG